MQVPLPPCPCPICNKYHARFRRPCEREGQGKSIKPCPDASYNIDMSPEDLDSVIYGPMWGKLVSGRGKLIPGQTCRVVSVREAGRYHSGNPLGLGEMPRNPEYWIAAIVIALLILNTVR